MELEKDYQHHQLLSPSKKENLVRQKILING
jgi:hypothetical protein